MSWLVYCVSLLPVEPSNGYIIVTVANVFTGDAPFVSMLSALVYLFIYLSNYIFISLYIYIYIYIYIEEHEDM